MPSLQKPGAGAQSSRTPDLWPGLPAPDPLMEAHIPSPSGSAAVLGEITALLDRPHAADVWVTEDSAFYVADAALLEKDPTILLHVARIWPIVLLRPTSVWSS
jgi:hypothetical protein